MNWCRIMNRFWIMIVLTVILVLML
jgi:hypothetical protein